jgi:limonene-1,2-epoxide hydrolase
MLVTRRNLVAAGGLGAFAMAVAGAAGAVEPGMASAGGTPSGAVPPSTALPSSSGLPASSAPSAASPGTIQKSNLQLVKDFCKAWGDDPPDADNMVGKYMTDDCIVRFGDTIEPVTGHDAAIALFQTFLSNGERYDLKILETFARGPIVVNSRVDSTIKGTRVTHPTPVVGVFVIKDGKIKEWSDFV